MPVIFTTANLWTSDVDLSAADLRTGQMPHDPKIKPASWIYFQYPISPSLKHGAPTGRARPTEVEEILEAEFVRSIVIVSAAAAVRFLETFNPEAW